MAAVLQLGKLPGMVDEHRPGTMTVLVQLIHTMAAAQHTVLVIALQPGHPKLLLTRAVRMALPQDPRLLHMVAMMVGGPRRLLTKATVVVHITNGAAISHLAAGLVVVNKTTLHMMLLLLVRTSQLLLQPQ